MLRLGYLYYQKPRKKLPSWLFYTMFWLIIPPMIVAMMAWEIGKSAFKSAKS